MSNPRLSILRACKSLVKPWAKYLLTQGVSYREFDDIVRAVFVDVATSEFGLRGRPTNASRVAVLTGLTRKQIKKIRDSIDDEEIEESVSQNQASLVLAGWYADKEYSESGVPRVLPFEGDISFSNLVRKYGKDIPPRAMLRELLRTQSVEQRDDGQLKALARWNVSVTTKEKQLDSVCHALAYFMSTITHNLMNEERDGYLERRVVARLSKNTSYKEFDEASRDSATALLEKFDRWLADAGYDTALTDSDQDQDVIGAGVYFFNEKVYKKKI